MWSMARSRSTTKESRPSPTRRGNHSSWMRERFTKESIKRACRRKRLPRLWSRRDSRSRHKYQRRRSRTGEAEGRERQERRSCLPRPSALAARSGHGARTELVTGDDAIAVGVHLVEAAVRPLPFTKRDAVVAVL